MTTEDIARVAHETLRAYSGTLGEYSQAAWQDAEQWVRQSKIDGVEAVLGGATPRQLHTAWCESRETAGWVYGPRLSYPERTHPCLVPYNDLSVDQRRKDTLFSAVVKALVKEIR